VQWEGVQVRRALAGREDSGPPLAEVLSRAGAVLGAYMLNRYSRIRAAQKEEYE